MVRRNSAFFKSVAYMLAAAVFFSSCAIGPTWHGEVTLPTPLRSLAGKKVIVTDFKMMKSATSITQSYDIKYMKESVYVRDASERIASRLRKYGITAESRVEMQAAKLHKDEILVRGAIIGTRHFPGLKNLGQIILISCTLLIIGGVLPSPVPFYSGAKVTYRVEGVDPQGKILFQTDDQVIIGEYKDFYIWSSDDGGDKSGQYVDPVNPMVADMIADALVLMIKPEAAPQKTAQ